MANDWKQYKISYLTQKKVAMGKQGNIRNISYRRKHSKMKDIILLVLTL